MTISKDDAALALSEIDAAGGRLREVTAYAQAAPFLVIWGLVWMACDLTDQFAPAFGYRYGWTLGVVLGTLASTAVGVSMGRKKAQSANAGSWRYFASWLAIAGFIVSLFLVIPVTSGREVHSVFGLLFGFIYIVMGIWTGWRLVALGAALIALTLIGFYEIGHWYPLFMGLVSGGALLLGGLWLRRI
ncbi:MAG TPA: hypothetical protein VGI95_19755 [Caulobacteraceae bacterium]|jgi:hypothetical protein